jgi:outer membrane protein OmpA-like peptidoglycan-associated protein
MNRVEIGMKGFMKVGRRSGMLATGLVVVLIALLLSLNANAEKDAAGHDTDYKHALHTPGDPPRTYHVTICEGTRDYRFYPPKGDVNLPANGSARNNDKRPKDKTSNPATGSSSGTDGAVDIVGHRVGESNLTITVTPQDGSNPQEYQLIVHVIDCSRPLPASGVRGRDANDETISMARPPVLEQGFIENLRQGQATTRAIAFTPNSTGLAVASESPLSEVARILLANPRARVEIQSHTASMSSAEVAFGLSQRRAEAVKASLVREGIPADRLMAKGYGQTRPVASNASAWGRSLNERIVFSVLTR